MLNVDCSDVESPRSQSFSDQSAAPPSSRIIDDDVSLSNKVKNKRIVRSVETHLNNRIDVDVVATEHLDIVAEGHRFPGNDSRGELRRRGRARGKTIDDFAILTTRKKSIRID